MISMPMFEINMNSPAIEVPATLDVEAKEESAILVNTGKYDNTSNNKKISKKINQICPPRGKPALFITNIFLIIMMYGFCWGATGDMSLPGGRLFILLLIFSSSYLFGVLASLINLPDLFGMIVSGIVLRNIPLFRLEQNLDPDWSSFLRSTALAIILVRAGMGLDPSALKRLSCAVVRLAFFPCIVEICCDGIIFHFLLGLPWDFAFILGSVLAAVSPAVVVPCLLNLSAQGYGVEKGIPTLVIAASSIDDVLAISIFGILIGVTFAEGNIMFIVLKSPIEIVIGASFGLIFGSLLWYIPHVQHKMKMLIRFILMLLSALAGLFVGGRIGFGGSGPFAALLLGFVAQIGWRKETYSNVNEKESVSINFEIIWTIFKPFLFGLIGAEVSFTKLDVNVMGIGLASLFIGLCFRMVTTFLVVNGNNLNIKEKIFITISWLPKATVQAAIGGVALDMVRKKGGTNEEIDNALKIVSIAVLSILVTAPLGAMLIVNIGPRLLSKEAQNAPMPESKHQLELETSKSNINIEQA